MAAHAWLRRLVVAGLAALLSTVAPSNAQAHDAAAWGGLFRSRDGGLSWFRANPSGSVAGALAIAVDPTDSASIWLGTDSGLFVTHNGGLDWADVAPGVLGSQAVFAVAVNADGRRVMVGSERGVFRSDDGLSWQPAATPPGAIPSRGLLRRSASDAMYLVGWHGLFRSDDWGNTWNQLDSGLPDGRPAGLVALPDLLLVSIDGHLWASHDDGHSWVARNSGLPGDAFFVQALAGDPSAAGRVWVGGADRIMRSDDSGLSWQPVGQPLPDQQTDIHGVSANAGGNLLLVSTHRGLYFSDNAGATWTLLADNLPGHIEAGPVVRDAGQPSTIYVGFSLTPYAEQWARTAEGRVAGQVSTVDLLGAAAFLLLVASGAVAALQWLARARRTRDIESSQIAL